MNRKKIEMLFLGAAAMLVLGGCGLQERQGKTTTKTLRIGVSVYDQYDTFVSELISCFQSYSREKEKDWEMSVNLDIRYAENSQLVQNGQMDDFIADGVDVVCINLVDRTDASRIIEKAKKNHRKALKAGDIIHITHKLVFMKELRKPKVQVQFKRFEKVDLIGDDVNVFGLYRPPNPKECYDQIKKRTRIN